MTLAVAAARSFSPSRQVCDNHKREGERERGGRKEEKRKKTKGLFFASPTSPRAHNTLDST